ncbi:hypothetical protein P9761_28880 [Brevibacillus centrosporus]|uniref:hypothetical protein n=1 Tax=Brevibacillus centrosporus TaxID=54910 RepID=UPI002E1C71A5|nr:hypothetical protein [Brevibacillus centrosporus]
MDVEVYYGGLRGGTMPYTVLPAFRLFCKQNGFQTKWDPKNKRIDLDSGLKGKICVLTPGKTVGDQYYVAEILGKVQRFLSNFGIEVVRTEKKSEVPKVRDVAIRFSLEELRTTIKPKLELFQSEDEKRKSLINSLHAELKHTGITCVLKAQKEQRSTPPSLAIKLLLPIDTDLSRRKAYGEKIAFYLASGILQYFHTSQQISPISYLPMNILKEFFSSSLIDRVGTLNQGYEEEQALEQEPNRELKQEPEQVLEQEPEQVLEQVPEQVPEQVLEQVPEQVLEQEPEQVLEQEPEQVLEQEPEQVLEQESEAEEDVVEPEPKQTQTIEFHRPVQSVFVQEEQNEIVEEAVWVHEIKQAPVEKRLEAEVFLDYTLFHSDLEHRPFLLIGNLYVKNTGTEDLINPIICLRVSPMESIKLGGQILPPNLVETMGVQSSSGIKGWRYLEDDWFSQAQERGEYWIAPIQPILISPKATEPFQNFQISIKKPENGSIVTVEAVVLFNEQEIHFPANNRIAISF